MEELIKINGLCAPNYEESEMETVKWQSIKECKPLDDQIVLLLNAKTNCDVPVMGYYDKWCEEFFALDTAHACPLSVTHFLAITKLDKKCDAE